MHVVFLSLRFPQDVSSLIALTRLKLINEVKVLGGQAATVLGLIAMAFVC